MPALSASIACPDVACPPRLIRLPDLMLRTALSRSEIYRRVRNDPSFPKPTTLGVRCVAWVGSEVSAYITDHIAQRDAKVVSP